MFMIKIHGGGDISQRTSNAVKGLFALIILFHHIVYKIQPLPIGAEPFKYIAFPIVAGFFFMSGYGLSVGLIKKGSKYWNGFFRKRVVKVLIPYVIVLFVFAILSLLLGRSLQAVVTDMFTLKNIPPMWYVWVIVLAYVVFYLSFRFSKNYKQGLYIYALFTLVYLSINVVTNENREFMFASISAMTVGIWAAFNWEKLINIFEKKSEIKIIILTISCGTLFVGRLGLSLLGYENVLIHTILRNSISILFVVDLALLMSCIEIKKKWLLYIGTISYEIYLVHPFLLYSLTLIQQSRGIIIPNEVFLLVVPVVTIILSDLLHRVVKKLPC